MKRTTTSSRCHQRQHLNQPSYENENLAIVIVGASGDLARRKTYPSLYNLYRCNLLPCRRQSQPETQTFISGYGRTRLSSNSLREKIVPNLVNVSGVMGGDTDVNGKEDPAIRRFLDICHYQAGNGYDDEDAFLKMHQTIGEALSSWAEPAVINTLIYMAIPPGLFEMTARTIYRTFLNDNVSSANKYKRGWTRILFEKPFGRDLPSYMDLSQSLLKMLSESQMYRIDHYLGKSLVQNIPMIRRRLSSFASSSSNGTTNNIWSRDYMSKVIISIKETVDCKGRGGYYDTSGAIRDLLQNHVLQVMALVAMEYENNPMEGSEQRDDHDAIRDAKSKILDYVGIPTYPNDCVLGQYNGYDEDSTVQNDSRTETYAAVRLRVNNERWRGVDFILMTGKALDERKAEIRFVLKNPLPSSNGNMPIGNKELVLRIQPESGVYMETSTTSHHRPKTLSVRCDIMKQAQTTSTKTRATIDNNDAYSKLILDALKGNVSNFVRDDELKKSWEIFTPLLNEIESLKEKNGLLRPFDYACGSDGPKEAKRLLLPQIDVDHNNLSTPQSKL